MKKSNFNKLYGMDFNLYHLFAMNQHWKDGSCFTTPRGGRRTSALLYLKDSRVRCVLSDGSEICADKGCVLYLPQNSEYTTYFYKKSGEAAESRLVEFELRHSSGRTFTPSDTVDIVSQNEEKACAELFDEAVRIFEAPVFSYSEIKSVVYSLITEITKESRKADMYSKEFSPIAPAIAFIEKNSVVGVSVAQLADMCHISEVSFRTLFKKYYGMTPSEYCMGQKIAKAKKLLRSDMYYIGEISQMLGFEDSAYFSKVFKKRTGMLPKEYMKK